MSSRPLERLPTIRAKLGSTIVFAVTVTILLSFGYFPVVGYGLLTAEGYRRRTLPADLIGFAVYTYHWVPCLYVGLWHVVARHVPVWWKTARSARSHAE